MNTEQQVFERNRQCKIHDKHDSVSIFRAMSAERCMHIVYCVIAI